MTAEANTFASGLIDLIASAKTDAEVVTLCKKYEAQVKQLKADGSARFHHILNIVQLRRKDLKRNQR